jgi:hypothetical protein
MAQDGATRQGVSLSTYVKFGHQMHTIRKWGSKYLLLFTNGKIVIADKVILNIGTWNFNKHLDKDNNILFTDPAVTDNLRAVYALAELSATKVFLHYEQAWWIKAGLTKGTVQTDEMFRVMRFHGGHVLCSNPSNVDTCRGLFFASYQLLHIHEFKSLDWQNVAPDGSSNLYVVRNNNSRDAFMLDMMHTNLMKIVAPIVNFTDSIAKPTFALFANWFEDPWNKCGAYPGVMQVTPGTQEATAIRPLPNEDIFIAQIDWMTSFNGFAEASLIMAERVASKYFGLPRPSYITDTVWYDYVIKTLSM